MTKINTNPFFFDGNVIMLVEKWTTPLIEDAFTFANNAHFDQKRKYTNDDYIIHPCAVANLVNEFFSADWFERTDYVTAAILHDVVEDTPVTMDAIYMEFGETIGNLVAWLTDITDHSDGNRKHRKEIERKRLANAPAAAQTIKVCDLIDNTKTIAQFDPDFAKIYKHEKKELLEILTRAEPKALEFARKQCSETV